MDGWMNVPAAGCPSVHPSLSDEETYDVTGGGREGVVLEGGGTLGGRWY